MADAPVDARFLLANERTFLAYVRTALSLQVAGLAVLQFLTEADQVVRSASRATAATSAGSGPASTWAARRPPASSQSRWRSSRCWPSPPSPSADPLVPLPPAPPLPRPPSGHFLRAE
jgi:putative membrane protein